MMATWTSTTLGSICKFQAGDGFPKDLQGDVDGEYPVAKVSDMNLAGNELFIINANNWLSKKAVDKAFKLHPPGSVIFAKIGIALTSNRRRILVRPTVIDNNMMSATCTKDIDPRWFYSLLTTLDFNEISSGSALPFLTVRDLSKIAINVPPLPKQRAIAAVLGALDDKIALNRKMNATLEAMTRALFRDWFVDFGPTRAKMEGRVPYLSPDLWSLFPDRLDDEGKPEGWEVSTVKEIGNVVCGKTPPTAQQHNYGGNIPFITIPDMHGKIFVTDTSKTLSQLGSETQKKKLLPTGSICVSCIATLGLVVITTEPSQTNQQINSVIPQDPDEVYYWYWALRLLSTKIVSGGSGGSVLANLSTGRFSALSLLHASPRLRKEFSRCVAPLFERIKANQSESRTLAQTRDLLLPHLMSGELRVADLASFDREAVA